MKGEQETETKWGMRKGEQETVTKWEMRKGEQETGTKWRMRRGSKRLRLNVEWAGSKKLNMKNKQKLVWISETNYYTRID